MKADIIVGLQHGDCGKGKVTHHLCKEGDYTHVIRYNGGCNAGHTIFHEGEKFVTHHIPAGVFFGIKSIIGPGCVIDAEQFYREVIDLSLKLGPQVTDLIKVAKNAHVITEEHLEEDGKDTEIGTTKKGNGPAYRDKYARVGVRAEKVKSLEPFLVDIYDELHGPPSIPPNKLSLDSMLHNECFEPVVLFEGAQGFGLDIDWGEYPYVTSSHCTVAGALLNGVPPQAVRNVWGIAKIYETYVGKKEFQPEDPIFDVLQSIGQEYGATTGRPRQCNWLDWDSLEKAIKINGVNNLVFNKVDILKQINTWNVQSQGEILSFNTEDEMKKWILGKLSKVSTINVYFSSSPNHL
jgi:adenylosuccinate synthase